MTKKRFVSTGLPGPIMLSHQPSLLGWPSYTPATWCEALRAWHTSTALDLSALSCAVGLEGQVVVADGRSALQREGLRKVHGLGRGNRMT